MKLLLGIDANVIDLHLLRKDVGVVWRSGPVTADGKIQDDEEAMIEDPLANFGPLLRLEEFARR